MRLLSVDARVTRHHRAALAGLIESSEADLACVHRGPRLLRWRSINAALGRRSGLVVVGGGRPAGANLLLSRLGVDALGTADVRWTDGRSRLSPAGAALARLRYEGTEFVLVGATLMGNAAQRIDQAGGLRRALADISLGQGPAIICAQGLDRPGTGAWQALVGDRVPIGNRVFVDARVTVREHRELGPATDARTPVPVVVVVDFEPP